MFVRVEPGSSPGSRPVVVEQVEEELRVRVVADRDEEPVRLQLALLAGVDVAQDDAGHVADVVAEHPLDDGVQRRLDLRVRARARS